MKSHPIVENILRSYNKTKHIMEFKKADDNQDEPFYGSEASSEDKSIKKTKTKNDDQSVSIDDSPEEPSTDPCISEISQYDMIVTFLRSKGLDPYKISPKQRDIWKQSPAFSAWKRINQYESVNSHKKTISTIKEIYKKKVNEDLLDVDKLNKNDSTFGKVKVEDGIDDKNKKTADVIMTRDKTLTGSKDCNIIEINPKLAQLKPYQYSDKDRDSSK